MEEDQNKLKFEHDDRQIEFFPIVTGLSHHVYTYTIKFHGETHDQGYVILSTKVIEEYIREYEDHDSEPEVEPTIYYHLHLAESENIYLTEAPMLFNSIEDALNDLSPDLIASTGSKEYVSEFLGEIEAYTKDNS